MYMNDIKDVDVDTLSYEKSLEEANKLLDKQTGEFEITGREAKHKRYEEMFVDVSVGMQITEVANKYKVSRKTVYNALEYFKNTDLIKDRDINLTIAIRRIRKRIIMLNRKLDIEYDKAEKFQNIKVQSMLLKEIRLNEQMELNIIGLLKNQNSDETSDKYIILSNIADTGQQQININTGSNTVKKE